MFRIRDFSRFTRVSVKMLRRYDRLGLLAPAQVDPRTRYRYYSAAQLVRLQRIVAMRDLGFSLDEVAELLAPGRDTLRRRLRAKREEVERRLEIERARLEALETRLRDLDQGRRPLPDVVLREIAPVRAATRRARVPILDLGVGPLFEAVEARVAAADLRAAGPPLLVYHDREYRESEADVEVAVPVIDDAPLGALGRGGGGAIRVRVLPGLPQAACLVYAGTYDQLAEALVSVLASLAARRLVASGPWREAYLRFHAGRARELRLPPAFLAESSDQLVTEIQVPVTAAGRGSVRARRGRNPA